MQSNRYKNQKKTKIIINTKKIKISKNKFNYEMKKAKGIQVLKPIIRQMP